ncbi:hypothetical protein [Haloprofundus halobius]|uniref:hypothetical protein n=1 Tax=Haloprofundus halobius TaxID=2876194 RepID=UPI001CD00871|nr:hypothetical protein [Haloprofundus halobius]
MNEPEKLETVDEAAEEDVVDDDQENTADVNATDAPMPAKLSHDDFLYVLWRSKTKDDRDMIPRFLREEFIRSESEFRTEAAKVLGKDADDISVSTTGRRCTVLLVSGRVKLRRN